MTVIPLAPHRHARTVAAAIASGQVAPLRRRRVVVEHPTEGRIPGVMLGEPDGGLITVLVRGPRVLIVGELRVEGPA